MRISIPGCVLVFGSFFFSGCSNAGSTIPSNSSTTNSASTTPANRVAAPVVQPPSSTLTAADIAKLKWIEGDWKGSGEGMEPFYERYRFKDANTLAVTSFDDESMKKESSTTLFTFKDGKLENAGDSRWAASEITGDSVTFVPVATVTNTFKWQRDSDSVWKAILNWPAAGDKPARQKTYTMTRAEEQKR